ncbi:hypothetical protein [Bacillus smithii]|uniref:hypothetical protein n=1 Tax=Bacillus smithii TaxID=1479 RepID=UPI002E239FE4|nr:hypothetical protein [Bacillus smithii]MED1456217.1 hypothetical protein [Bacillus smithii]
MNILQSIVSLKGIPQERQVHFQTGEMFSAKIVRWLPQNMAEINIKGQKMFAKMEVPLQAGERYWFIVATVKNGLHLKVLANAAEMGTDPKLAAESLVKKLSLPVSPEIKAIAEKMAAEQWVLTKEKMENAAQWLKLTDTKAGLDILKLMMDRSLPFTKSVFNSLMSVMGETDSTHSLLAALREQMASSSPEGDLVPPLMNTLHQIKDPSTKLLAMKFFQKFLALLESGGSSEQDAAADLLQKWGFLPKEEQNGVRLSDLAIKWLNSLFSSSTDDDSFQRLFSSGEIGSKQLSSFLSRLDPAQQELVRDILRESGSKQLQTTEWVEKVYSALLKEAASIPENGEISLKKLAALLTVSEGQLLKLVEQEADRTRQLPLESLSEGEKLFQGLWEKVKQETENHLTGKDAFALLKTMMKLLGADYESNLLSFTENWKEVLKPQLADLVKDQASGEIKDSAEKLLARLNAYPILSNDLGAAQTIVMNFPLSFFGLNTDLTIKWSGKKNKDGKLDPDYCRILFYLDLKNLKEVVVDMQVQNRIVTLLIMNDNPELKTIASPLLSNLKEGLQQIRYQLSSVQFKPLDEKNGKMILREMMQDPFSTGVNILI